MAEKTGPGHNQGEYTVSELSGALKRVIEGEFGTVRVRGEISGLKRAGSGHVYFALKDESAVIDGVMWRGTAGRLRLALEDGMEVICAGRVTTFAARSRYQIVVESVELAGEGALLKLIEDRRRKLAAEGLFDEAKKKPLPFLPRVIGVVTSPTGAVIRDILHRLSDRFPVHVLIWPAAVQGEAAAGQVAEAIRGFNALRPGGPVPRPDVLIVARGGGSLEDLMAFNEEIVVRAAAESDLPLISAVGHETDTTLIDFASDRRAPTPTAAAEMAVPVRHQLIEEVAQKSARLDGAVRRVIDYRRTRLEGLARGLPDPRSLLEDAMRRLDETGDRLSFSLRALLREKAHRLSGAGDPTGALQRLLRDREAALRHRTARLRPAMLNQDIRRQRREVARLGDALARTGRRFVAERRREVANLAQLLTSYSYEDVLRRGYAVVRDPADQPITARAALLKAAATDPRVIIEFHDGRAAATVTNAVESGKSAGGRNTAAKAKGKRAVPAKRGPDDRQGDLL